MKLGTQILALIIFGIAMCIFGQGRGMINRIEREKVISIISSLKPEMTESDTLKFLLDHGLNWDWGSLGGWPANRREMWYRFGTTNIEELCVSFRPKKDVPYAVWKDQYQTNSSFFKAVIYRYQKGGLAGLWSTNVDDHASATNRP